jgi:hypothetical protein
MGLYDTIISQYPIPEVVIEGKIVSFESLEFQTKDLNNMLDSYLINIDGELVYLENNWTKKEPISKEYKNTNFHGILNFYKSYVTESDNLYMIDFFAKFTDGFIVNITPNVQSMPKRVIVEDVDTVIEKLLDN